MDCTARIHSAEIRGQLVTTTGIRESMRQEKRASNALLNPQVLRLVSDLLGSEGMLHWMLVCRSAYDISIGKVLHAVWIY
jgi:hypothetical protein